MSRTAYNAKDCVITIDGTYITGFGEDMITCEKKEDFFETEVGAQGDVVVNEINDPIGTIKLTTLANCPQKPMLLNLAKKGAEFPIWVTNKSLGEMAGGTRARVKKFPELSQGKTVGTREFEIEVFDYDVTAV